MTRALFHIALVLLSAGALLPADEVMKRMPVVFERAGSQTKVMLEGMENDPMFPRTLGPDGKVRTVKAEDWTSGFFPGTLWLLHEYYFLEALLRYRALKEGKNRAPLGAAE